MFSFDGSVTGLNKLFGAASAPGGALPSRREWHKLGLNEAKEIHKRTEKRGMDVENKPFKPYTEAYKKYKASRKRTKSVTVGPPSLKPNLTLTGRMLTALGPGVSAGNDYAKITLSGDEGIKAWGQQQQGREFLGIPDDRLNKLAQQFGDLIFKRI